MNYKGRSKLRNSYSEDESTQEDNLNEDKFYETSMLNEKEAKKDQEINTLKKISIKLMKIIFLRNLIKQKKFYVNKWRKIISKSGNREIKVKIFTKGIGNCIRKNIFNKINIYSQKSEKLKNSINKLTNVIKNKNKIYSLFFLSRLKLFSSFNHMRFKIWKNLLNHIHNKNRKELLKINFTKWIKFAQLNKKEFLLQNILYLNNSIMKIFSSLLFSKLNKIFLSVKREQKLSKLINKRILYKKFYNWNFEVDKLMIERKLKRKNCHNRLMKKIILNFSDKSRLNLKIFFIRWMLKNKNIKYSQQARIIQKFMRLKQIQKKQKFMDKNIFKQYETVKKIFDFIKHKIYFIPFNKIKNENKRRIIINFVLRLKNKNIENSIFVLEKIKNFTKRKSLWLNKFATVIQRVVRKNLIRKKIYKRLDKENCIRNFIKMKLIVNKLRKSFSTWKNVSTIFSTEVGSKVIQNFFRKKIENVKDLKKNSAKVNLNSIFVDFLKFKIFKPFFKNFVKCERTKRGVENFKKYLLRYFISKSVKYFTSYSLSKLLNFMSRKKREYLKDSFNNIKNFCDLTIKISSIQKIQKLFRSRTQSLKLRNIQIILRTILNKAIKKNKISLRYVLTNWKRNCKNQKLITSASIISNFIKNKWICLKLKKFLGQFIQRRNLQNVKRILAESKKSKNLCLSLTHLIKKKSFAENKIKMHMLRKGNFFYKFIKIRNRKNISFIKKKLFANWKNKASKYKNIEKISITILSIQNRFFLNKFILSMKLNFLNEVMKNLRKKTFFNNLKCFADKAIQNQIFANNLNKANKNFEIISKKVLREKIFKLFSYKVLVSFVNTLEKYFYNTSIKSVFDKLIINKFYVQLRKSFYEGRKKITMKKEIKLKILHYESNQTKHAKYATNKNAKTGINRISYSYHAMGVFMKILSHLDLAKIKIFFNLLKSKYKLSLLNQKLTSLELIQSARAQFFEKLCKNCDDNIKLENLQQNFYNLMKKVCVFKIQKILRKSNRIAKLIHCLKTISMHKSISELFYKKEIFKQLLFQCKLNKISRQKLSTLYKSFYLSYLDTTNEMFNEGKQKTEYEEIKKIMIGNNLKFANSGNEKSDVEIEKFY